MFLGPSFIQQHVGQLKDELHSLKYKGEFKTNNFWIYVTCHEKIYQQINNLNADGYPSIDNNTCIHYFLNGIDEPSLKTVVQIGESQTSFSTNFHA